MLSSFNSYKSYTYTADGSSIYGIHLSHAKRAHTHTLLLIISQEGPHSALNEEEFFDALEMAYQNDEMESNVS